MKNNKISKYEYFINLDHKIEEIKQIFQLLYSKKPSKKKDNLHFIFSKEFDNFISKLEKLYFSYYLRHKSCILVKNKLSEIENNIYDTYNILENIMPYLLLHNISSYPSNF
jgi:hypothetical protein